MAGSSTLTTTETRRGAGFPVLAAGLALSGWLGVGAIAALASMAETLVAFGDPASLAMADDGALVSAGRRHLVLRPTSAGAARRLYAGGAWLVLPAPGTGCTGAR